MNKKMGIASGILASTIWGGMYVVSKIVLESIPPFGLLTLRLALGIITLSLVSSYQKISPYKQEKKWQIVVIGVLGFGFSLALQFIGTKLSTAANGSMVTAATPMFVFIFSYFLMKEKITSRRYLALGLSSVGVVSVINPSNIRLSPDMFWGNIALLGAALTWGLYSVLVRRASTKMNIFSISLLALWGGLVVSIPLGILEYIQDPWKIENLSIVAGVLYLGIISTSLAAYLWNKAFEVLDASIASLTIFAQPITGALLGTLILNESITPSFMVGGVMIGIGLWLVVFESEL